MYIHKFTHIFIFSIRDDHTKQSQTKQILHDVTYM